MSRDNKEDPDPFQENGNANEMVVKVASDCETRNLPVKYTLAVSSGE